MSEENKVGRKANRRTVLKSLGAATALSTVGVSVSSARGKPSLQETVKQSHRVLQAAGPEKQHKFLRKRGIATAMDSVTTKLRGGGMSTQEVTTSEISLWFSLYSDCKTYDNGVTAGDGTYIAELSWKYDEEYNEDGERPMDYAGIGWDDNTWYYEDNNVDDMYTSHSDHINYKSGTSGNGPAWEVDDTETLAYPDEDDYFYTGVHLVWNGSDDLKDNKTISASYSHTWHDVTVTGVSVMYPYGVSVSVDNENNEWTKGKNDSDEFLRLGYNETEGCY